MEKINSIGDHIHTYYPHSDSLFHSLPFGIVFQNSRGEIISANPEAEKILGVSFEQMRGVSSVDPRWQAIHEDGSAFPGTDHPAMIALRSGELVLHQIMGVFNPLFEAVRWINVSAIPIKDDTNNTITGVYSLFEDITERKQMEAALFKSEKEFRLLADAMPQIVWITQPDGNCIYLNDQWSSYTGMTSEQCFGIDWSRPIHPEDRQRVWDKWQQATQTGGIYRLECRIRRHDGVYRWWLVRGVPVLDANGNIQQWFGTCTDIEEIKKVEKQLIENQALFTSIIESTPSLIFAFDTRFRFNLVNSALARFLGKSKQDVLGKTLHDVFPEQVANTLFEINQKIMRSGEPEILEEIVASNLGNGESRFMITSKFPVRDVLGNIKGIGGVATDITERKHAEEAQKRSRYQLETFIKQAPICVAMFDVNMNYLAVSDQWLFEFGRGYHDLIGRNHYEVHPDLPEHWKMIHQQGLSGTYLKNDDELWIQEDGSEYWSRWAVSPWTDEQGKIGGIIISSENITERKLGERKIASTLSLLYATMNSSTDAILVVDLNNSWVLVNRQFIELWNVTDEMLAAKDDQTALNHALGQLTEPEIFLNKVRELYATPEADSFDTLNFKNGKIIERYSTPQRIDNTVVGRVWSFRDVTEQKKSEQALQRENEKYLALLHNASDGIHILDFDGNIIEASESFCHMLGYQRNEVIGMNLTHWDAGFADDNEKLKVVRSQFDNAVRTQFETRHKCKDGSTIEVEVSGFPLDLDGKRVLFYSSRDITERKTINEKMQLLLAEQKAIIESDLIGIVKTKDRIIHWANPTFEKMLGYGLGELIGRPTSTVYPNMEAYKAFGNQAYPLLKSGKIHRSETEFVCKDGRHIWTDLRGVNLEGIAGESLWTFIDITERKSIEQLEAYRGEVLELLATGSPVETILNSIVCGIEKIAPSMIGSILILDKEGKHLHLGAAPNLPEFYSAAIEGLEIGLGVGSCGTVACTGKRVIVADIQTHPYWAVFKNLAAKANLAACWSEPILSTTHKVLGTFGIYHHEPGVPSAKDIEIIETAAKLASIAIEQKLIREELTQYQEHLEELVNQRTKDLQAVHAQLLNTQFAMEMAKIGIRWIDTETGQIVYSNRYAAEMLGYSVEEMLSMRVQDYDPNFPTESLHEIIETIRLNGQGQIETINRTKDGHDLLVEISLYYLPKRDDSPARLIGFITDITNRKESEMALQQAKLEAEAANLAKSKFLANMSHEIRTPMNAITGMIYLLLKNGNLNSDQEDKLNIISTASDHLLAIINDVLDLTKIESGKLTLEQTEFNMATMIETALLLVLDRAKLKGLNLKVEHHVLPTTLIGDSTRLKQMLINYLSNAVKFTENGEIILRISVIEETPADLLLKFSVQDSGLGITEEQKHRLFSVFEQADNSTTRKFGGTGLGLAINSLLAHLMNGEVGVESQPNVGSIFWFTARLKKVESHFETEASSLTLLGDTEALIRLSHSGKHLLVAEDIAVNRMVVEEILSETGLIIDFAEDGIEAVAKSKENQYDIILMDIQMPKMNGMEATIAIRQMTSYSSTPIIAMTGNAFEEDRIACLQAGMTDFLAKPVIPNDLFETLFKWLK